MDRGAGLPPHQLPDSLAAVALSGDSRGRGFTLSAAEIVSNLIFSGPLAWTDQAACRGQNELFFAPAGERPETRTLREARHGRSARHARCCRRAASGHGRTASTGIWGGESEEERAAAGFRVDMPVGRVARYPKGDGTPVAPRAPRRLTIRRSLRRRIPAPRTLAPQHGSLAARRDTRLPTLVPRATRLAPLARRRVRLR